MIPIYKPYHTVMSRKFAMDAVRSGWWSSRGIYIELVEKKLRELFGYNHIVLTCNGTAAVHLIALALKAKYPDVVGLFVPNNVYAAAWNPFLYPRQPYIFLPIDASLDTWNMDTSELETALTTFKWFTEKYALLVVHNISGIVNIPELKRKYPQTIIVEDNCEGFTGKHEGLYTGTQSFCSAVSFFGNKSLTAGEGGAFFTDDEEIYRYVACLHDQGYSSKRYIHNHLGYNYRMTNIQAAILFGQLMCIKDIQKKKKELFDYYRGELKDEVERGDLAFQKVEECCESSNWMFGVRVRKSNDYGIADRFFADKGIEVRPMFYPITEHPYITYIQSSVGVCRTENAKTLNKQCVLLPSYPEISERDREKVVKAVKEYAGGKHG